MDEVEIVSKCLDRIEAKYARRGKESLWDDTTRQEFIRAFSMVPLPLLPQIVDELLLNPPTDDRGRVQNWLPDPSDIVSIARKMSEEGSVTPSDVVSEILDKIRRFGQFGVRHPERPNIYLAGPPPLSAGAEKTVLAMGGWSALCTMESSDSVVNGLLLKHAQNAVEAEQQRLLLVTKRPELPPSGLQKAVERIGKGMASIGRNGGEDA